MPHVIEQRTRTVGVQTIQGAVLYGPRDIRFEEREAPRIVEPTDAILRLSATCICGSDLWPYRGISPVAVATPELARAEMIPSLLALADVLGTGWFAAVAADVQPGKTVVVVGDGAVGLLGVLAARQLGAERVIAMSPHPARQQLAREFGATDVVTERGDE